MSQYEDELAALEATKCPECHGSGTLDDADFGDISFHTWTCDKCKGTGKKQEIKSEQHAATVDSGGATAQAGVEIRSEGNKQEGSEDSDSVRS